jgi:hypothetical protein
MKCKSEKNVAILVKEIKRGLAHFPSSRPRGKMGVLRVVGVGVDG